ncbi:MAG: peptidylprolyl isomerase [Bacteroidales bacterium]|nr:peptidylprolyl isomerase [Bacteroidales bacterium]
MSVIFRNFLLIFFILVISINNKSYSQDNVVDKVIAVVGNNIILYSDIENQKIQLQTQGYYSSAGIKCEILEELLFQKLLITQAKIDSIEVTDKEIDSELDRRMRYFINQIGSEKKLEEYYNKSIIEIKTDLREMVHDQLITQKMQVEITGDLNVTPSEVRKHYKSLPEDSLPLINTEIEFLQIVKHPEIESSEIKAVKDKLNTFRERVKNGEKFSTLAVLYSEDPGSARNGGDLGYVGRGDLVPEFAAIAFKLKAGEISRIVKTEYGYHIIQLLERKGEKIKAKHILLKPKISLQKTIESKNYLDSINVLLKNDTLTFKKAARMFSDDINTKYNGGLVINPMTGNSKFETSQIDPATYYAIKDLKINEISKSFETIDENGHKVFKIVQLKSKTKPHKANLKNDYKKIQDLALEKKKYQYMSDWIKEKQKSTYIKINETFKDCKFNYVKWFD